MTWFYNTAYFLFSLFYLPVFLQKIRQASNGGELVRQRLGIFPEPWKSLFAGKRTVWLHAVSVGEVMALRRFVEEFLAANPGFQILLTTVTPTGQRIAQDLKRDRVVVVYFPFDFSFACKRFFETFRPQALLLAETEIWPNLLIQAKKFHVPVGILNARLSEKSARRYTRWGFLFRPLFSCLDFVLAQTEKDAERFLELGVAAKRVLAAGNMKFDNVVLNPPDARAVLSLKQEWNFSPEDMVWIAGSTHPKEEDTVLRAFCHLKDSFAALKLVLAPRHIERSAQIASQARKLGLQTAMATHHTEENFDVLVLNQLGTLKHLYQIADVVYVGGSLIKRGGQNPIEPASYKKPIVHGPHTFNFDKIYRDLDQEGGALMVRDEAQLIFAVRRLLQNEAERAAVGERAFEKIRSLQGATTRHVEWVSDFLTGRSQERNRNEQVHSKLFPSAGGRL
jgi:3-deoxy-D-manno-octulosonic-acid transferase